MTGPVRVLYVDDDPHSLEVRQELLEDHGAFTVHTETRPEDALERLDAGETFDCLLSDLEMPGMDGVEFLKSVRQRELEVPFILFTADESDAAIERAMEEGATDYIPKSIASISYRLVAKRIENAIELAGRDDTPEESDDGDAGIAASLQEAMDEEVDDEKIGSSKGEIDNADPENCPVPGCQFDARDAASLQAHFAEEREKDGIQARLHAALSTSGVSGDQRKRSPRQRSPTETRKRWTEGPVEPDELRELDRDELYRIARGRGIAGRSRLDREGLYEAITGAGQTGDTSSRDRSDPTSQELDRTPAHGHSIDPTEAEGPGLSKAGLQAIGQTVRQILLSERWPREETGPDSQSPESGGAGLPGVAAGEPITADESQTGSSRPSEKGVTESAVSSGQTRLAEMSGTAGASDDGEDSHTPERKNRFALSLGDPAGSQRSSEEHLADQQADTGDKSIQKSDLTVIETDPGESSLITADTHEGHGDILCDHHLGEATSDPVNLLLIRYQAMDTARLEELASTASEITFVAIGHEQNVPASMDDRIEMVEIDKADDLRRLGIVLTRAIENWNDDPAEIRVCIDSLNVMLRYADVQKVFRFLRLLFAKFESADAVTHAHLDPNTESSRDVSIIKSLFDKVIELEGDTLAVGDT